MAAPLRALAEGELHSINPATLEVVGAVRAAAPKEVPVTAETGECSHVGFA